MSAYDFHLKGSREKGVLLVHGLTGSPAEMRFVGKALHKMGFTVYAPTLAGHRLDEKALLATTYEDWTNSLRTAIRQFAQEVDEVYMAGICVGGGLALYAAHLEPELVKGVTIYSPTLNYDGWGTPFYYSWAEFGIPVLVRLPLVNRLTFKERSPYGIKSERVRNAVMNGGDGIAGTLPHFPGKALYQNHRLNKALEKALPAMTVPTLLIHSREDDVSHPRNATAIQKLHGGSCTVHWLEDSYHMIHVDQERHKVAALTADFFGRPAIPIPVAPVVMQEALHG